MNLCCCKAANKRKRRKSTNADVGAIVNGGFEGSDTDSVASDNEEVYGLKPSVRRADKITTPRTVEKNSSLLNHSFDYRVHYVGIVEGLYHHSKESHSDFVDTLENLVKQKTLSFTQNEEKFVELTFSKDGLKITDLFPPEPKVVLDRYSLLGIIHMVTFDQNGQTMLAIKAGDYGQKTYNCLVFQCVSEVQADQIFRSIQNLFDAVCKMRLF